MILIRKIMSLLFESHSGDVRALMLLKTSDESRLRGPDTLSPDNFLCSKDTICFFKIFKLFLGFLSTKPIIVEFSLATAKRYAITDHSL